MLRHFFFSTEGLDKYEVFEDGKGHRRRELCLPAQRRVGRRVEWTWAAIGVIIALSHLPFLFKVNMKP